MERPVIQLTQEQIMLRQAIAEAGMRCAVHGETVTMTSAFLALARGGALCWPCVKRLRVVAAAKAG